MLSLKAIVLVGTILWREVIPLAGLLNPFDRNYVMNFLQITNTVYRSLLVPQPGVG